MMNIRTYAVSNVAIGNFTSYFHRISPHILTLGIPDQMKCLHPACETEAKTSFAVIAKIGRNKGQDIFLNVVCKLGQRLLEQSEFHIIGDDGVDSVYAGMMQPSIVIHSTLIVY